MKKLSLLSFILCVTLILNAQNSKNRKLSSNPFNHGMSKSSQIHSPKSIIKILKYDNNEILKGLGLSTEPYTLGTYIELPTTITQSYIGKTIDYLRFGMDNNKIIANAKIEIYENNLSSEPVYQQELTIDSIASGWNQIKLNNGYKLGTSSIFIGILVETNTGGYTQTYDSDPTEYPLYSGHTTLNGEYIGILSNEIGYDADYNIQAIITDGLGANYNDLAIIDIKPSNTGCSYASEEILRLTILNQGNDSINAQFNLNVTFNDQLVSQQVTPTTFYPGIKKIVNMPAVDMSQFGIYNLHAEMDFVDATPENNKFTTKLLSGNATLRVEILTDGFAEETSWKVVDQAGTIVANGLNLEPETDYITELCLIDTLCYTWIITDLAGDGFIEEDTLQGHFALYYNDSLIAFSPTNGNFGFEFSKFGIGKGCLANDISLEKIELPNYELPQTLNIKGTVHNRGIEPIASILVKYIIDNFESSMDTLTNLNLTTSETIDFTHTVPFNFNANKSYNVAVLVSLPDSILDENQANNSISKKITINDQVVSKTQLIEQFTSSTNAECFNFNPEMDGLLAIHPENYTLIRYPMNWPENGDPYATDQTTERAQFYSVTELPAVFRNGVYDLDLDQEKFEKYANEKTILSIFGNAFYSENQVTINTSLSSVDTLNGDNKLFTMVVENSTQGNIGTNGEIDFYNVLMQMIPSSAGNSVSALNKGDKLSFSESFDMTVTNVEEMNDLTAVIFLQNEITKEIIQSTSFPIDLLENIEHGVSNTLKTYPNPFSNSIIIENNYGLVSIQICDITGRIVSEIDSDEKVIKLNTNQLVKGIYFAYMRDIKGVVLSQKIIKQ